AGIAAKAVKEVAYHVRHSGEWVIRLGDGTEESTRRMADAVEALAPYVDEVFADDEALDAAADLGIIPSPKNLRAEWDARIDAIFAEAQLERAQTVSISGGRQGRHGEQMGFLLADLQYVQRTYPGLTW
ncbi:MAG: phenylacetate-CoA oxygenase subunit PaaI, partial [Paracoccaceae bacterium]|nr:phenylacetate-CoA oxygenase subunit PaaI [Paracoccaceae bacterium]